MHMEHSLSLSPSPSLFLLSFFLFGGARDTLGLEPNLGRQAEE